MKQGRIEEAGWFGGQSLPYVLKTHTAMMRKYIQKKVMTKRYLKKLEHPPPPQKKFLEKGSLELCTIFNRRHNGTELAEHRASDAKNAKTSDAKWNHSKDISKNFKIKMLRLLLVFSLKFIKINEMCKARLNVYKINSRWQFWIAIVFLPFSLFFSNST